MGSYGRRQAAMGRQDEGGERVKKKALAVAGLCAASVFAVLFLTMTATASKNTGKGSNQGECYGNVFTDPDGDTHANVSDGYIQSAHFEIQTKSGEVDAKGWIKANMKFDVFFADTMQGHLAVDFYVAGFGPGHFESKCIHEAGTEEDGGECEDVCRDLTDRFEAEFEGSVTGLPGIKNAQNAVAQLAGAKTLSGALILRLQIEKGTACSDSDVLDGGNDAEGHVGKTSGSIAADDVEVSRFNFCL
jgi:hypothetical protein